MEIHEEMGNGVVVVALKGRLDSNTSGELERRLLGHLARGEKDLVIDLRAVEYISSAGLRVLLAVTNRLRPAGGHLVLCSLGESVREVFDLAGFTGIFDIETSRDRALARFPGKAPP